MTYISLVLRLLLPAGTFSASARVLYSVESKEASGTDIGQTYYDVPWSASSDGSLSLPFPNTLSPFTIVVILWEVFEL